MKIFHQKQGFTLVELLVVVAIIGLLASILIANLNVGRSKAKNNVIKENTYSLKLAAELEYDENNSYEGVCLESPDYDISNAAGTNFLRIRTAINNNGGTTTGNCYDSATKWCAEVTDMPYNSEDWCVDSAGYAGSTDNCGTGTGDNVYSCTESS